jgi:NADPH-dependent curcumin reductase CurA
MNDSKSYVPSFEIGKPIQSGIIAQVIDSRHPEFRKEDFVSGNLEWKEYQVSDGKG